MVIINNAKKVKRCAMLTDNIPSLAEVGSEIQNLDIDYLAK